MHDTPHKGLFNDEFRFDSSGCVRVQNIRELIAWLLQRHARLDRRDQIDADVPLSGERIDAKLDQKRCRSSGSILPPGRCPTASSISATTSTASTASIRCATALADTPL